MKEKTIVVIKRRTIGSKICVKKILKILSAFFLGSSFLPYLKSLSLASVSVKPFFVVFKFSKIFSIVS